MTIKRLINALRWPTRRDLPASHTQATRDLTGAAQARAMAMVEQGQRDLRLGNRQAWIEYHRVGG